MRSFRRAGLRLISWAVPVVITACGPDPADPPTAPRLQAAKPGGSTTGPTVSSADPAVGAQGQRLYVRILGSGYNSTAVASWERNGAPDPKVTVNSTTFLSSSEVVADVTIAADAEITLYDIAVEIVVGGGRKKGVGIEKFQVSGPTNQPDVPYYLTLSGGMITNPTADQPPLAGEQLVFAYHVQQDTLDLVIRPEWAGVGRAHTAFVNTKAAASLATCKKGNKQLSDAHALALIEEFTQSNALSHGLRLFVDAAAVTTGTGTGAVFTSYYPAPGSLFYPSEIFVKVFFNDRVSPENGTPRVTLESTNGTERVYRFHAGFGTANVWWRGGGGGGGPHMTVNCKLWDDVYVTVRPGS